MTPRGSEYTYHSECSFQMPFLPLEKWQVLDQVQGMYAANLRWREETNEKVWNQESAWRGPQDQMWLFNQLKKASLSSLKDSPMNENLENKILELTFSLSSKRIMDYNFIFIYLSIYFETRSPVAQTGLKRLTFLSSSLPWCWQTIQTCTNIPSWINYNTLNK